MFTLIFIVYFTLLNLEFLFTDISLDLKVNVSLFVQFQTKKSNKF